MPALSFVTGGARSGKSRLAERLVQQAGAGLPTYIATAQAFDDEMADRIERHRAERGPGWRTVEAPLDLAGALQAAEGAVLVDCATLWLSNHLLAGHDLQRESNALLAALACTAVPVVVVSNEVGWGIVPENPLARRFRDAQGWLNQRLAAQAGLAVAVISGLPVVLKGSLPAGMA